MFLEGSRVGGGRYVGLIGVGDAAGCNRGEGRIGVAAAAVAVGAEAVVGISGRRGRCYARRRRCRRCLRGTSCSRKCRCKASQGIEPREGRVEGALEVNG